MTRQAPAAPENVIWGLDGEVTCMNAAQNEKASRFRALHDGLGAFVIPNPWDVGSARILTGLGFQALATSSGASACALGRRNHGLTRDEALAHARPIVDATDLPVSSRLVFIEMALPGGLRAVGYEASQSILPLDPDLAEILMSHRFNSS